MKIMTEEEYNLNPMMIIGKTTTNENSLKLMGFFPTGGTEVKKLTYAEYLEHINKKSKNDATHQNF